VAFSLLGRRLQFRGTMQSAWSYWRLLQGGKNMRPRILLIAASLVLFPLALISGRAMALDVQKSCESEFKRYCGSYEAYSTSGNACMRSMGRSHRLNTDCLRALEEGGYVTQADREVYNRRYH
jgi:hypothetical protein